MIGFLNIGVRFAVAWALVDGVVWWTLWYGGCGVEDFRSRIWYLTRSAGAVVGVLY